MVRERQGVTLLEVLVVISILVFLVMLSLPAIQRVRGAADRVACENHLRQIGTALHLYHHDYGSFPPGRRSEPHARYLSWMVLLLPYIEQKPLYDQSAQAYSQSSYVYANPPHIGLATVIRLYVCPTDSRLLAARTDEWGTTAAFTSYVGAAGGTYRYDGVMPSRPRSYRGAFPSASLADVLDGTSNTLCVGERPPPDSGQGGWWYPAALYHSPGHRGPNGYLILGDIIPYLPSDPQCGPTWRATGPGRTSNPCDRFHFWSLHGGGSNFLFVDGSVRFLSYSADPILPALISINGGEPVTVPD
ncbi:MAG TPA: DUF1559 domain-containing protein [Gemmatales bacterium]|nr:DUF1559 domain-containing protein [Gemmatales bacterium]HMP58495.1 DUF1559 domain-containing protein [Gemmatales bacterium]